MKSKQRKTCFFVSLIAIVFLYPSSSFAQTFTSGSTGGDGAFAPSSDINLVLPPDGVFHYTTVNIPAGVTVTYSHNSANTPVTILATGDVNIEGTIDLNGKKGLGIVAGVLSNQGGLGGPGGFPGGSGGTGGGAQQPVQDKAQD